MKLSPLTLAIAAGAAFLLLRSSKRVTPKQAAVATGAQTYNTPTAYAAILGSFVAAALRPGASPNVRTDNVVGFDWKPIADQVGAASAQWGKGVYAGPPLGVFEFGTGFPSTDASWRAQPSVVTLSDSGGSGVDSFLSAPVYDLGTGFTQNPFLLQ